MPNNAPGGKDIAASGFEWPHIKALAKELDFISVHSCPYHYGEDIASAVTFNKKHYADIKALFPDKQVVFTEFGWSSDSSTPNYFAVIENTMRKIIPKPAGAGSAETRIDQKSETLCGRGGSMAGAGADHRIYFRGLR